MSKYIEAIYFACNDNSELHKNMSINMVKSGKDKLDSIPFYCLYYGNDESYILKLQSLDVNVIKTKLEIIEDLEKSKNLNLIEKNVAKGAYLRVDILRYSKNYKYILYVDCDVIFVKNIINENFNYINDNYIFGCCSEHNWNNNKYFNTGVMFIDIEKYKLYYDDFIKFIISKDFKFESYDQGAINEYFKYKIFHIDNNYNYKPYWISNYDINDAKIIHFHGLKPDHLQDIIINGSNSYLFLNKNTPLYSLLTIWGDFNKVINDSKTIFLELYNKYN